MIVPSLAKVRHTQALEFICRQVYGYPSWNVACSAGSEDRIFEPSFCDCLHLVGTLANTFPALQVLEEDLTLSDTGYPWIMESIRYRRASIMLGAALSEEELSGDIWDEYLVSLFVDKEQMKKRIFGWEPESAAEWLHATSMSLEYKQYDIGDYPWDRWAKKEQHIGELSKDLISIGREVYRECYMHTWNRELQLFCGYLDHGQTLSIILRKWPAKAAAVISVLMTTDGGAVSV